MSIAATCPECGARYRLDDARRGQRICCKQCRTNFPVPGSEGDPPAVQPSAAGSVQAERSRERRTADTEPRRSVKKSEGVSPLVWVLGGIGLAILVVMLSCAGIIYKVTRTVSRAAEVVKNQPIIELPGAGGQLELFPHQPADIDEALVQLKDPQQTRRQSAAHWVQRQTVDPLRRAEVARALEPLLEDVHAGPRLAAVRALEKWADKENVPALVRLLESDPSGFEGDECRHRAIDTIVRLKDARGAAAIARSFKNHIEREQTRRALEALGPAAETAVWPYLKNIDWNIQVEACRTLRRIGTQRSLPELEKALAGTRAKYGGFQFVADSAQEAIDAIKARPRVPEGAGRK